MTLNRVKKLPEYAFALAAHHEAFADELKAIVASLPIDPGSFVLDLACGDGSYAGWLAERAGPNGAVLAVDIDRDYLATARTNTPGDRILFAAASLEQLPCADGRFDLAWCAQSLFSLPDPVEALRRLAALVRPGGRVAVMENDSLHQVLLPWPIEVELTVRSAELMGFVDEADRPRKYYVARQLIEHFRAAGLENCQKRTWVSDRQAPLDPATRAFLAHYLKNLRDRAAPHLEPSDLARIEPLFDPSSPQYLLDGLDLSITLVDQVVWGQTAK
ncbi:MAG: class I SAM-dependent methyltransferase [Isosphaeraceae bacterium]